MDKFMDLNTFYIIFVFLALYGIVATVRNKKKESDNKSAEVLKRLQEVKYKRELQQLIDLKDQENVNIAKLRKSYFLNYADAKKLLDILKNRR